MTSILKSKNSLFFDNKPILKIFKRQDLKSTDYNEIIVNNLHITSDKFIYVEFQGTNLMLNKFICSSLSEDLPNFSKILFIFSVDSELYAICECWNILKISSSCLGYIVKSTSVLFVVKIIDLPYTKS